MNAKLDVGRTFTRIFEIYGKQFGVLIPAALILFVPVALVNGLLTEEGGVLLSLVASGLAVVATFWYQGMVVEAARDILDGRRDQTIGSLFSAAGPVVPKLIVAGFLAGIAIAIGLLLLIVPGLYLLTIWAVIIPVIVLERADIFEAFGRSRQLVKGNGWQVFGVIVLLFIASIIVSLILNAIFNSISDSFVGYAIAQLIANVLTVPFTALAAAVIYFELKNAHGEPIPGVTGQLAGPEAGTAAPAAAGTPAPGPEAPAGGTSGSAMPPAESPGSGSAPSPSPGAPPAAEPPAAPPAGGTSPAGGDPQPPSSGPQAPPNA